MAKKLEITNPAGITQIFELYYRRGEEEALTDFKGFTDSFGVSVTYERSPFQQGATAVALRAETRALSFVMHILRPTQEELESRVASIVEFMNPYLGELTIIHDNGVRRRRIQAYYIGHTLVSYEDNKGYGALAIELMADNAFFEDENIQVVEIGSDTGAFLFPIEFPFQFGADLVDVTIENTGDYHNPVEMVLAGPLESPELVRDVYEGSTIVQSDTLNFENLTVLEGWSIRLNTEQGREEATLIDPDGVEENLNRYLSADSNYWQLFVGTNVIRFTSSAGNPYTQIRFRRKFIVA